MAGEMVRSVRKSNKQRAGRSAARSTLVLRIALFAAAACFLSAPARADIVKYTNRDDWFNAVGGASEVTTIDFTGFPEATIITDQYQSLGVAFTDGTDRVQGEDFIIYPQDGWGLRGTFDTTVEFDRPLFSMSVDYPGSMQIDLYLNEVLVGSSTFFTSGFGNFAGVISTDAFNKAILTDPADGFEFIDDLHFVVVPSPTSLIPFTLLFLHRSRIRRRAASFPPVRPGRTSPLGVQQCTSGLLRSVCRSP